MVQKIKQVKVSRTDVQEAREWAEVLSHRNKLLLNSDWTQASDAGLTPECVAQWRNWRYILKGIRRISYPSLKIAEKQIKVLASRPPFNLYLEDLRTVAAATTVTFEQYRAQVIGYLDYLFNNATKTSFLDNPALVDEQYHQAMEYKRWKQDYVSPCGPTNLVTQAAELQNVNKHEIVRQFEAQKHKRTKRLAELKAEYIRFREVAKQATTDVELTELQEDAKQWISTLT